MGKTRVTKFTFFKFYFFQTFISEEKKYDWFRR